MPSYLVLHGLHVALVITSVSGFAARWALQLAGVDWRRWRPARALPHLVDSGLMAAGIGLAVMLHQVPGREAWLTAKLLGLLAYILLGHQALKPGAARGRRALAGVLALLTVAWMAGVAHTHSPHWGL